MKRSEVVKIIAEDLCTMDQLSFQEQPLPASTYENDADALLSKLEKMGMKPPRVSEEDAQAIMTVYYGGYSLHRWDEDLEKDEAIQGAKKRRAEFKAKQGDPNA